MTIEKERRLDQYTGFDPWTFEGCQVVRPGKDDVYDSMIYFVYVALGGHVQPVYVGQTKRGSVRIQEHIIQKNMPVDKWFYIPVPEELLDEVERYYIETFRLFLNLVDNPEFRRSNGQYIWNREELHDIQRRRIQKINAIRAIEKLSGCTATHLFSVFQDEEHPKVRHLSFT